MAKARKMPPTQAVSEGVQRVLTSLRLEGISLSPESIADLELVQSGKLSEKEALARVLARVRK
jgi:hypothetical protein